MRWNRPILTLLLLRGSRGILTGIKSQQQGKNRVTSGKEQGTPHFRALTNNKEREDLRLFSLLIYKGGTVNRYCGLQTGCVRLPKAVRGRVVLKTCGGKFLFEFVGGHCQVLTQCVERRILVTQFHIYDAEQHRRVVW